MEANKKIDLINAYRQLQTATLPLKKTEESIVGTVMTEFQEFVSRRISELLGEKSSKSDAISSNFSDEEIDILRAIIDNIKAKQSNTTISASPRGQEQPIRQRTGPKPEPLGNRQSDPDPTGQKFRNENAGILAQLKRMENEGPEY